MKVEAISENDREKALELVSSVFMQYEAPDYSEQGIQTLRILFISNTKFFTSYSQLHIMLRGGFFMYYEINKAYAQFTGSIYAPNLTGNIFFNSVQGGTEVYVEVWGLPLYQPATNGNAPISPFGFHIHEQQLLIVKRAEELKDKYPDKAHIFDNYIKSQREECDELENEIEGVTMLLQRE